MWDMDNVEEGQCGRTVLKKEYGRRTVLKKDSVEAWNEENVEAWKEDNVEDGQCGRWTMLKKDNVEEGECGRRRMWKMRNVEEGQC